MYVKARVTAGSRTESFVATSATHFLIQVREKAERNQANERTRALIAEHFQIPVGKVRIVNGHHSPSKLLSVDS